MRVVALGASNLTLGFPTLVTTARDCWGTDVEVLAALGHGRSYGAPSRVLIRRLPGILESGLWGHLEGLAPASTRALITDVGNDILYGRSAAQTLAWVEECVDRLQRFTRDIALTDVPMACIRALSRPRFLFFRSVFVPDCRLSLSQAIGACERLVEGLVALATARELRLVRLKPEWYGVDPIHIRRRHRRRAWRTILGEETTGISADGPPLDEAMRLHALFPERQWLLGFEHVRPQSGLRLKRGGRVWLY